MKISAISILTASALFISASQAFATPDPAEAAEASAIVKAIQQVGNQITALSIANKKSQSALLFQKDNSLQPAADANLSFDAQSSTQQAPFMEEVKNLNKKFTTTQITNTLAKFPKSIVNINQLADLPNLISPSESSDNSNILLSQQKNPPSILTQLTTDIPASDTLYLDNQDKPTKTYNSYFNFDSLYAPNGYTPTQYKSAKNYITYVTEQYDSPAASINFQQLKSNLNSSKDKKTALKNFVTDPTYQKYQLSTRSALAAKSVNLYNLTKLFVERTPVDGLGKAAGLPNIPGLQAGAASPLQVENYIANHRVNNPDWFKQMETASPAVVQREQVVILAEIESELQRNHLDSERLLATLSVMALQSNQSTERLLQSQDIRGINKLIKTVK